MFPSHLYNVLFGCAKFNDEFTMCASSCAISRYCKPGDLMASLFFQIIH